MTSPAYSVSCKSREGAWATYDFGVTNVGSVEERHEIEDTHDWKDLPVHLADYLCCIVVLEVFILGIDRLGVDRDDVLLVHILDE